MMKKIFLTLLLIYIAGANLSAKLIRPSEPRDTISLSEVEVTATKTLPVELTPLDVTVVSGADIENSAESNILPVLMNRVAGMFVTERGIGGYGVSNGAAGTVNIRGVGGGNSVLFLIDGQPQWAAVFGHSLPDTYSSADVAKVEVVKGPSSLLYGSNAMGGSVNIITRRASLKGFAGSVRLAGGSYNTQKYGIDLGYAGSRLNLFGAANFEHSGDVRPNSRYWSANEFISADYRLSRHWSIGANLTLTEAKPHNPGTVDDPLNDMYTRITRGTASVSITDKYGKSSGGVQIYANWGNHRINDGYSAHGTATNGGVPRNYLFRSDDFNVGMTLFQTVKPWRGNDLSLGVDLQNWGGHAWNEMNDGSVTEIVDKSIFEVAGYALMQQRVCSILSLSAGARVQHSSQFGNVVVPQAGFIANPFRGNVVKFSWGKGFRSPNIRELYMYPPHNPELKPEYLWNYDVEIRQHFLDGRIDAGVSLFFIDGKDMIQTVKEKNPWTGGQMTNKNIGKYINKGVEVDASYAINSHWTLLANYCYLHSSENVLYAPKNKLFGEVIYRFGGFECNLESMSIWGLRTGAPSTENYSLLNGKVAYTFNLGARTSLSAFCKVDNITATRYETISGYPMPRATVLAGIHLKF